MSQVSWVDKTLNDRYQIEALLGQGGMSSVYKAKDPNLGRVVAVKMIHPHLTSDEEFVKRFEEEAKAVAQLRHPNLIQVYDFNKDDGVYYMVLEFVPGETLQERLKRINAEGRRLPFEDAVKFATNICEAADYAHKRGMIHRDIKPANVMLDVQGLAILMDFGIAKIVGGDMHTATGAVLGTALYMAPEQIRGEKIDQRVDIYAIGVTLFEMLNGRPPYEADSAMTLMMKHLNDPIPDLRDLQPGAPEELVKVVEKSLAKDPSQRYQSAGEMAIDLNSAMKQFQDRAAAAATVVEDVEGSGPVQRQDDMATVVVDSSSAAKTSQGRDAQRDALETAVVGGAAAEIAPDAVGERSPTPTVVANPMSGSTVVADQSSGRDVYQTIPPVPSAYHENLEGEGGSRKPNMALIGGGIALVFVLLCAIVGGAFAFTQLSNGDDTAEQTETAEAVALLNSETTEDPTEASPASETPLPSPTFTSGPPTGTPTPLESPTPTSSPTAAVTPGEPFVRITKVDMDTQGTYFIEYELLEFTDQLLLDGYHLTFFFDNIPPDQVGAPFETNYYMYAGPSPFDKFNSEVKSDEATQICALVTQPNHIVIQRSGICFDLPETATIDFQPSPTPPSQDSGRNRDRDPGY